MRVQYSSDVHSLQCPKCLHGMEPVNYHGVNVDRCTHCQGIWFDDDELQTLLRESGAQAIDTGSARKGRDFDRYGEIRCPHCQAPMEPSADWRQTHIWYEVCRQHGIFLDAGEFTDLKQEGWLDKIRDLLKGSRRS